jgi:hypothetical protein
MNEIILSLQDRARLADLLRRLEISNRALERQLAAAEASRLLESYGLEWADAQRVSGNW